MVAKQHEQHEQALDLMQAYDLSLIRGADTWYCGRFGLRLDQKVYDGLHGGWYISDPDPAQAVLRASDIAERMIGVKA